MSLISSIILNYAYDKRAYHRCVMIGSIIHSYVMIKGAITDRSIVLLSVER